MRVRINEKLSSDKNQPGDLFTATLVQPLVANGLVIAQPGQNIAGRVSEAVKAKDGNGRSRLGLDLTELSLVDGQQVPIRTQLIEYHRPNDNGRDAGVVVGTTAAGAAIGAIAGGGFGAGVGALSGALAGVIGVLATHGHATEIHPEAVLTFRTIDTVTIATDRSGGAFQPVQQYDYRRRRNRRAECRCACLGYTVTTAVIRIPTTIRTSTIPTFTGQALGSTTEAVSVAIAAADFAAVAAASVAAVVALAAAVAVTGVAAVRR